MRSVIHKQQVFTDGDTVYHHGSGNTGTVYIHRDTQLGEPEAQVSWHDTNAIDDLAQIADWVQVL